jgi:hypothetical protein
MLLNYYFKKTWAFSLNLNFMHCRPKITVGEATISYLVDPSRADKFWDPILMICQKEGV